MEFANVNFNSSRFHFYEFKLYAALLVTVIGYNKVISNIKLSEAHFRSF